MWRLHFRPMYTRIRTKYTCTLKCFNSLLSRSNNNHWTIYERHMPEGVTRWSSGGTRRKSKGVDDLYTSRAREAPQKKRWCVRIKIISMGALGVGKSCLIKRFCEERFVSKYISTIGIDYGVKPVTVKGEAARINFWDLSGHPDFFEIRNEFYKDSQGAVLVYDVANRASFEELEQWLIEAADFGAGGIPLAVCANKIDKRRVVSEEEGQRWAQDHGFLYFETSAYSGANVGAVFSKLFEKALPTTNGS